MKSLPRHPLALRAAAAASRLIPGLRAADRGMGGHDGYFAGLQDALKRAGVAWPVMVIDWPRLEANIAAVRRTLAPSGLALRVVSKSLQAPDLLRAVLDGTGSNRLMSFNSVMLEAVAAWRPGAEVLLGRPLPAAEVAGFVRRHVRDPAPAAHPQWLADSVARLAQYAQIARAAGETLRVNLEIDVGLHRGGLADPRALAEAIDVALAEPNLQLAGLMGYDAHALGARDPAAGVAEATRRYGAMAEVLATRRGDLSGLTLNTAGSGTYPFHLGDPHANEVSIGSAFVKPANFDWPALADLQPACFIAQPVLKLMDPARFPGREALTGAFNTLDPNSRRGLFLYGGYGDARPVSPRGLRFSPIWGGRGMLEASDKVEIAQDDFVFLRPRESEGALLQFGDLAIYDGEAISAWRPTFPVHA